MIFVQRNAVGDPFPRMGIRYTNEVRNLKDFYKSARAERAQERYPFRIEFWNQHLSLLLDLFHNKCAYCETSVTPTASLSVEHFRPKAEAKNLDGTSDPDHYWWLAYTWTNLYPSCASCNFNKATLFPIVGRRARFGASADALAKEVRLFVDPCVDRPEEFLLFNEDGKVTAISMDPDEERLLGGNTKGGTTIERLGLNRTDLVQRRASYADETLRALRALDGKGSNESRLKEIVRLVGVGVTHAGSNRQLAARFVVDASKRKRAKTPWQDYLEHELRDEIDAVVQYRSLSPAPVSVSVNVPSATSVAPSPSVRTAYIETIDIRNFRAIDRFHLAIPISGGSDRVGWKMLLGENGTGKSSVLKAVALALLGANRLRTRFPKLDPSLLLSRRPGVRSGSVRVRLSTSDVPIEFRFSRTRWSFPSGADGANVFVRGYGATRLLPNPTADAPAVPADEAQRVTNLFDPHAPLHDAITWLHRLFDENPSSFDSAGLTIKDLVDLDVAKPLSIDDDHVMLDTGSGPVPLEQQSDGYQAVLALTCDILAGMPGAIHDKHAATGIVLLDEIDAHLHPRWKMRIVDSLRRTFPHLQFLATTHEPLCLRGLGDGEVAVLRRDPEDRHIHLEDEVPSPNSLRIDQLLTSPLFGLASTIDPFTEAKFVEYYELLAKTNRTPTEETRCTALREALRYEGMLGATRRDQLIYEVIDEYLAHEKAGAPKMLQRKLREATKRRVYDIWRRIGTESLR